MSVVKPNLLRTSVKRWCVKEVTLIDTTNVGHSRMEATVYEGVGGAE